jgi:hypothetical protein
VANSSTTKQERLAQNAGGAWSKKDLAAWFGVSDRTITAWVGSGQIPPPDVVINRRVKRWRYSTIRPLIEGRFPWMAWCPWL